MSSTVTQSRDLVFLEHKGQHLVYQSAWNTGLVVAPDLYQALKAHDVKSVWAMATEGAKADLLSEGILYTDEQAYREHTHVERDPADEEIVAPRVAYIQVTRACNLRCTYCYNRDNLSQSDRTSLLDLTRMMARLREMGVETLILTGGEPTVRTDVSEMVQTAKRMGFSLQLLTNGTRLRRHVDTLHAFSLIIVSVDTLSSAHNVRQGLDVPKLLDDLRALPKAIRDKTTLRAVVGREHSGDWREVGAWAQAHGFGFMTTVMMPSSVDDFARLPHLSDVDAIPEPYRQPLGCMNCGAGRGILALDGDGFIYPCQALIREPLRLANVFQDNWTQTLVEGRRRLRLWERTVDALPRCRRCSVKYICGGGCMAVSYDVYGDLFATVSPLCTFRQAEAMGKLQGILDKVGSSA